MKDIVGEKTPVNVSEEISKKDMYIKLDSE